MPAKWATRIGLPSRSKELRSRRSLVKTAPLVLLLISLLPFVFFGLQSSLPRHYFLQNKIVSQLEITRPGAIIFGNLIMILLINTQRWLQVQASAGYEGSADHRQPGPPMGKEGIQ